MIKGVLIVFGFFIAAIGGEAYGGSLTLYAVPPSRKLDWSSQKNLEIALRASNLEKQILERRNVSFISDFGKPGQMSANFFTPAGFTVLHVDCVLENGSRFDRWLSRDESGRIILGEENTKRLSYYNGFGRAPRYLRFGLTPSGCAGLYAQWLRGASVPNGRSANDTHLGTDVFTSLPVPAPGFPDTRSLLSNPSTLFAVEALKSAGVFPSEWEGLWQRKTDFINTGFYDVGKIWNFIGEIPYCQNGAVCPDRVLSWLKAESRKVVPAETQVLKDASPPSGESSKIEGVEID